MCWANFVLLDKLLTHISHPNIFSLPWPDETWVSNLLDTKDFSNMVSIFLNIWMTVTFTVLCQLSNWLFISRLLIIMETFMITHLIFLGLKAAAESGILEVFHNIWFWLLPENIKKHLLADFDMNQAQGNTLNQT